MNRISLWISATTVNHVSKRLGLEVRRRVSPAILIKGLFGSGLLSWSGSRLIILVIRFSIENPVHCWTGIKWFIQIIRIYPPWEKKKKNAKEAE